METLRDGLCFTARQSPGYLIRRAAQLFTPRFESLFNDQDLNLSQWIALKLIHDGVASTGTHLADTLGHNSGAMTRMIDQLENRGLLTRHRRTDDRRIVTLALTDAGLAEVHAMAPRIRKLWTEMLSDFSPAERTVFVGLLGRLVERLERDAGR